MINLKELTGPAHLMLDGVTPDDVGFRALMEGKEVVIDETTYAPGQPVEIGGRVILLTRLHRISLNRYRNFYRGAKTFDSDLLTDPAPRFTMVGNGAHPPSPDWDYRLGRNVALIGCFIAGDFGPEMRFD